MSKVKAKKSKVLVIKERSRYEASICEIPKPYPHGSKDVANVNVFSLKSGTDTGVMTIVLWTSS